MNINLNGLWTGVIIYGPEYEDWESKELYFDLDIKQDSDTFTGVAFDIGGIGMNPDSATIKGFIEGNEISFVKQYKSNVSFDENDKEIFEKDKPGPEINYWGTFDPITNVVEGNWEINIYPQKFGEGWFEDLYTGTWTMKRKITR